MAYKERLEPLDLQILIVLNNRMNLQESDKQYFLNLKKGYEGEVMFDKLTENLKCDHIQLNDLLLKTNNTTFQLDSLIIVSDTLYYFEVKNYFGDYFYETDKLYKKTKIEISNPLNQLSRNETLLKQLLHKHGINIKIKSFVVFINPEFTLYQAPQNKPYIFPTQVNRFLKQLEALPSKINKKQKLIAEKLGSLHLTDHPYSQLPKYEYEELQKEITCKACYSFSVLIDGKSCICMECGFEEHVNNAVLRSVEEFRLLFPKMKMTTAVIHDWCRVVESKRKIRGILAKHFKSRGAHRYAYFE